MISNNLPVFTNPVMYKGKLITFEGAEGSGKSTQAKILSEYLESQKKKVLFLREPGGVKISEAIRRLLLDVKNADMNKECETLLYMAARAQLVEEVILPALKRGVIVLCDRFLDSTVVYQGDGCGIDKGFIRKIGQFATKDISPDLTLLFDIDAAQGLERAGKNKDRIEARSLTYHNRVRRGYLQLAKEEPERIKVIPVDRSKEAIFEIVKIYVDPLLKF